MRIIHSPDSAVHSPPSFFRRGKLGPSPETAERYRILHTAIQQAAHEAVEAADHGLGPIAAVHDAGYLDFLSTAWARRAEMDPDTEELLTTQFAGMQMHRRSDALVNQLGYHTADTSTPIRAGTWRAVYGSAQASIGAADAALERGAAYALCRPPGHHAYADRAGGFCYLNNTAIAAQRLRDATAGPVAVLDVDVHHGNGTQGIFYARSDVLTVSIHAETSNYFPLYAGYADEAGVAAGEGFNLNLPLAHGAGDRELLAALEIALARIERHAASALIVALGFDAAAEDPVGVLQVTTDGFARAATAIAGLQIPTVLVQEGGYPCPTLAVNLLGFLAAFDQERSD